MSVISIKMNFKYDRVIDFKIEANICIYANYGVNTVWKVSGTMLLPCDNSPSFSKLSVLITVFCVMTDMSKTETLVGPYLRPEQL